MQPGERRGDEIRATKQRFMRGFTETKGRPNGPSAQSSESSKRRDAGSIVIRDGF